MFRPLSLAAASIAAAAAAQAATYTDRATFESAVTKSYVESFQSLSTDVIGFDGSVLLPSGLQVYSESNRLFVASPRQSTNPTTAIGSNRPLTDSLYLDLGGDFGAFGADIFQNLQGGSQAGRPVRFSIEAFRDYRPVASAAGLIAPNGGGFLGLTSRDLFDTVRVLSSPVESYEVVDNVTVGTPVVAAVPVPTGLPLLAAALGALGLVRRRPRG